MPDAYKFSHILRIFVERKGLTWKAAAKLCGLKPERMEKIAAGQHVPLAPDVLRIQRGLGFLFEPEDFEKRGIEL